MDFQIKKIILWPKKKEYKFKEIDFELNKINIITGASRTGKSAIIPIIDYCLGSSKCYIPVETIRNSCSWFGVLISSNKKEILLARKEPGKQKSTDEMFMLEDDKIEIPMQVSKNATCKNVKYYLDQIAKLSFLDIEENDNNQFLGRPAFRDLLAFCFQPQNIVANANTLFYKADTTEHRTKLINIFPYILGAVTSEILAKRQEINRLTNDLKRKQREIEKLKNVSEKWIIEIKGWISVAQEYGLIQEDISIEESDIEQLVNLLKKLINIAPLEASVNSKKIFDTSNEIVGLRQEENDIAMKLTKAKSRYTEMSELFKSMDLYRDSLTIQAERLNITKWLTQISKEGHKCPICGNVNNNNSDLKSFYEKLENIEEKYNYTKNIPVTFEREYDNVKKEIKILSERLSAVQKRIKLQNEMSNENGKYTLFDISRFLGKVEYVSETLNLLGTDSELQNEIDVLKEQLSDLRDEVDEESIEKKIYSALRIIANNGMKLIPLLDSERPDDPIKIDYKNLTVVVSSNEGRDDYLWEIGSGSNWLTYHIAITLAFQIFFRSMKDSPVPNFLVYDQPSQVYFPQKLSIKEDERESDPQLDDEDQIAVRKIFTTMAKAIELSKKNMQIIVLEHADKNVWGGINNVHEVCEWRGKNKKLIPEEWIE